MKDFKCNAKDRINMSMVSITRAGPCECWQRRCWKEQIPGDDPFVKK